MTPAENLLAQCMRLLEEGTYPRSACSRQFLSALAPLLHAGIVIEERQGAGRRLVVRDSAALRQYISCRFPNLPVTGDLLRRAVGVARFRDSKTFPSDTPEIVCVRSWADNALLLDGHHTEAVEATLRYGVFSFLLTQTARYSLGGRCALVENPAIFTHFEHLQFPVGLVIHGRGRLSSRALEWLENMNAPDFELLHLPDYDPAGLTEFERLRNSLGRRAQLYLPPNLEPLFARFSNRTLLEKPNSQSMLANLRRSKISAVRQVVALIDTHNAGLDQEALLIKHAAG